jgi:malate dehydrogenase (quinone)
MQRAGMRVQIIKRDPVRGGILKFGTEIVAAQDRSLVALLGASPGASTAAAIMIKVIELCFGKELAGGWKAKLEAIIPSYGHSLIDDAALTQKVRADTAAVLGLQNV